MTNFHPASTSSLPREIRRRPGDAPASGTIGAKSDVYMQGWDLCGSDLGLGLFITDVGRFGGLVAGWGEDGEVWHIGSSDGVDCVALHHAVYVL